MKILYLAWLFLAVSDNSCYGATPKPTNPPRLNRHDRRDHNPRPPVSPVPPPPPVPIATPTLPTSEASPTFKPHNPPRIKRISSTTVVQVPTPVALPPTTSPPTSFPTLPPTSLPTLLPTSPPTSPPTAHPVSNPTPQPTLPPTSPPTSQPTSSPTSSPTSPPTSPPTTPPTPSPTSTPTSAPTSPPTSPPTLPPTPSPTFCTTYTCTGAMPFVATPTGNTISGDTSCLAGETPFAFKDCVGPGYSQQIIGNYYNVITSKSCQLIVKFTPANSNEIPAPVVYQLQGTCGNICDEAYGIPTVSFPVPTSGSYLIFASPYRYNALGAYTLTAYCANTNSVCSGAIMVPAVTTPGVTNGDFTGLTGVTPFHFTDCTPPSPPGNSAEIVADWYTFITPPTCITFTATLSLVTGSYNPLLYQLIAANTTSCGSFCDKRYGFGQLAYTVTPNQQYWFVAVPFNPVSLGAYNLATSCTTTLLIDTVSRAFESASQPGYYIRHMFFKGYLSQILTPLSSDPFVNDTAFYTRAPNDKAAGSNCYSFESKNYPTYYLRHYDFQILLNQNDNTIYFPFDSTFCVVPGLRGTGFSFQSDNYPTKYIHVRTASSNELWIDVPDGTATFNQDASFFPVEV